MTVWHALLIKVITSLDFNSQFTALCVPNVNLLHFAFWIPILYHTFRIPIVNFGFQLSIFLPFCFLPFGFQFTIIETLLKNSCKPLWIFSVDNAAPTSTHQPLPPRLICSPNPVHIACEPFPLQWVPRRSTSRQRRDNPCVDENENGAGPH